MLCRGESRWTSWSDLWGVVIGSRRPFSIGVRSRGGQCGGYVQGGKLVERQEFKASVSVISMMVRTSSL